AEAAADEEPVEIDDAAVDERQAVAEVPPDVIVTSRQLVTVAERHAVDEAETLLLERFAGAEIHVRGPRRGRGLRGHLRRDAARVVRDRLIGEVHDREKLAVAIEIDVEASGDLRVLVAALLPEAVELRIRDADQIADALAA